MKLLSIQFKMKTTSTHVNEQRFSILAELLCNRCVHSPEPSRAGQAALPSHHPTRQRLQSELPHFYQWQKRSLSTCPCLPYWAQTIHHSLFSISSSHQPCSHKWVVTVMKPRTASKKLHDVTLISVDQSRYIGKQVLYRKRQGKFLLGKSIPEVVQCFP